MWARKRLQVNFFVANSTTQFDMYNQNIPKGLMFPNMYIQQSADITPELADVPRVVVFS